VRIIARRIVNRIRSGEMRETSLMKPPEKSGGRGVFKGKLILTISA